jgi:hypothetical protein
VRFGGQLAGAQVPLRGVRRDARDEVLAQLFRQRVVGAVLQALLGPFQRGLGGGRVAYLGLLAYSRRSERDDLVRHVRHVDRP